MATLASKLHLHAPDTAYERTKENPMSLHLTLESSRALTASVLCLTLVSGACASMNRTEKGAAGGAAAGAAVGGLIGKAAGSTAKGAILGAVVGGAAGAAIGHRMDQQAKELDAELPNATVERVGEGIQVTFASGILFDVDSDVLRQASRDNLSELARSIADYEGTRILVVGHTDATGSDAYNQSLSERRSNSARTYLLQQGVTGDRIEAVGRGESEPVDSNETDAGRQENRRVEVAIFANEEFQKAMLDRYGRGG
jgi:outer membrane protein OmpA-like peptidoglycan-associated protein